VTVPFAVKSCVRSLELAVAASVFVVLVVVVLAAQVTEFGLLATVQAASALCGSASSAARTPAENAVEASSPPGARMAAAPASP
jgi:hypothetical protein